MREKLKAGFSAKTVRHFRATLRAALNAAIADEKLMRNVAKMAEPPQADPKPLQVFNRHQATEFLELVKGHRLEALFVLAISCALREGELLGLRWSDIDLDAGRLTVNVTQQRVKLPGERTSKLTLLKPKSKKSRRSIDLPQLAISALRAHRERQCSEREQMGSKWREHNMIFPTRVGTYLDQRNMLRDYYKLIAASGLPKIRFHDLRHSTATLLIAKRVPMRFIMELLGHSSIQVTMDTYGHLLDEMRRETADDLDEILTPNSDRPWKWSEKWSQTKSKKAS